MTPFVRSTAFVVSRISLPMTSHLRSTPTPSSSRVCAPVKRDAALRRAFSRSRSRARSPASFVSMRPCGCGGASRRLRQIPSLSRRRPTNACDARIVSRGERCGREHRPRRRSSSSNRPSSRTDDPRRGGQRPRSRSHRRAEVEAARSSLDSQRGV